MIYNFDTLPDRTATESIKWHTYAPEVLPMFVADMDFISPEPVVRALRERVEHGVFGYPQEIKEFRPLIQAWLASHYHWSCQPEDLVFIPGVVVGLNMACVALAEPGEGVLMQPPVYGPFLRAPQYANAVRQEAPLHQDASSGSYEIDWEVFEAAITKQARLFMLCNPHNPVGRVFRRDELERMAEICLRHNLIIISDEIHCDLVYSGCRHIPIASLDPEVARNTITLMAPSKTFNIAGLNASFTVIQNPELRKRFEDARRGLVGGINLMGWVAARAAFQEGQEWLDQLLVYLEGNRDFLYGYIQQNLPDIDMAKPEGTYLAWLDCRKVILDEGPFKFFLEKAQVALGNGPGFGTGGEGFVRLNFGCPRSLLEEGVKRMKSALEQVCDNRHKNQ